MVKHLDLQWSARCLLGGRHRGRRGRTWRCKRAVHGTERVVELRPEKQWGSRLSMISFCIIWIFTPCQSSRGQIICDLRSHPESWLEFQWLAATLFIPFPPVQTLNWCFRLGLLGFRSFEGPNWSSKKTAQLSEQRLAPDQQLQASRIFRRTFYASKWQKRPCGRWWLQSWATRRPSLVTR